MAPAMTIGQLAQATGVSAKTIRYYEQIGVLPRPSRSAAGYRQYAEDGVHRLRFVRRARTLGLSLRHLRALSGALDDGPRAILRPRLLVLVRAQLSAVRQRMSQLQLLQWQLEQVRRRLLMPPREGHAGRCRCLEVEGVPGRRANHL